MMRESNLTYSYCVENPDQRPLLAIAAHLDLRIYGGDASDALAHIPIPYFPPLYPLTTNLMIGIDINLEIILIRKMYFLYREPYRVIQSQVDFGNTSSTKY